MRRWRKPGLGLDVWLGLAFAAFGLAEQAGDGVREVLPYACQLLLALAVGLRRRRLVPAVLVLVAVVVQASTASPPEDFMPMTATLVVLYAAAAYQRLRISIPTLALTLAAWTAETGIAAGNDFAFNALFQLVGWVPGRLMNGRRLEVRDLADQAEQLRREATERAEQARRDERDRLAREFHDVVSHTVAVMVVQAAAAQQLLPSSESAVADALAVVQRLGREAVEELRGMLSALDREPAEAIPADPLPTLSRVGDLVAAARAGQVTLGVDIDPGALDGVSPIIVASAYRVAQEAVTNVIKHAAPARASLRVRRSEGSLVVTVTDDGPRLPRRSSDAPGGSGRGLLGAAERVRFFGGRLDAGPRERGFEVRAMFPVESTLST